MKLAGCLLLGILCANVAEAQSLKDTTDRLHDFIDADGHVSNRAWRDEYHGVVQGSGGRSWSGFSSRSLSTENLGSSGECLLALPLKTFTNRSSSTASRAAGVIELADPRRRRPPAVRAP